MMISDTVTWNDGKWEDQRVVSGSAFNLLDHVGGCQFDSIVFSPPYANRFDYFESFKVELWFGSFVRSYGELNALRKASMRSHLNADFRRPLDPFGPLEELLAQMDTEASSWRMGVPDLMRGYFHDLRTVLTQCRQVLPNGRCNVVVGNSAFAGVIVPTDVLTALVGLESGFSSATLLETRHLTVAPQQRNKLRGLEKHMRETVVVLE
jgi:site-specific DNA-methyltransferase (adenine-specific)